MLSFFIWRMKNTFTCNDSMIITIPIGSLKDAREGQLLPEKFHCVFKDTYKVFAIKGKPKPLGAVQAVAGVFVVTLGLIFTQMKEDTINLYTLPSTVVHEGIRYLIMALLVVETLIALILIYWLSKAVCRQNFNTLPIILLKQEN
ncbi:hypothetical protein PAMP_003217 [Pampus punctatissimus]